MEQHVVLLSTLRAPHGCGTVAKQLPLDLGSAVRPAPLSSPSTEHTLCIILEWWPCLLHSDSWNLGENTTKFCTVSHPCLWGMNGAEYKRGRTSPDLLSSKNGPSNPFSSSVFNFWKTLFWQDLFPYLPQEKNLRWLSSDSDLEWVQNSSDSVWSFAKTFCVFLLAAMNSEKISSSVFWSSRHLWWSSTKHHWESILGRCPEILDRTCSWLRVSTFSNSSRSEYTWFHFLYSSLNLRS